MAADTGRTRTAPVAMPQRPQVGHEPAADDLLAGLLDALLAEVPGDEPPPEPEPAAAAPAPRPAEPPPAAPATAPATALAMPPLPQTASPSAPPAAAPAVAAATPQPVSSQAVEPPAAGVPPAFPEWAAAGPFKALLVEAGGYRLAVPLLALHSVSVAPAELTTLPAQPDWHLGVTLFRGDKLTVVDLPRLLKLQEKDTITRTTGSGYLLIVANGRYALRCDRMFDPVMLEPDAVRWHQPSDRPWQAGMLPEQMCVLLDVGSLLPLLDGQPPDNHHDPHSPDPTGEKI